MKIAGIDYSISSPAICVYDTTKEWSFSKLSFLALPESKKIDGVYDNITIIQNKGAGVQPEERHDWLAINTINFLKQHQVECVYIEDYAFAAKGRVFHIGENCGLLKHYLWKSGIEINVVSPPALKKFATGKGNAKKENMIEAFVEETNIDLWEVFGVKRTKNIPHPIDDLVDAFYLAKYGKSTI